MNIIQQRLVSSYTTLVMAEIMTIEDVPEIKVVGSIEYPIRSEVEIEVAKRTVEILG